MTQFAQPRSSIPPEANPPPSLSAPRPLIEIPRTLRVEDVSDFNRALAKFSGDHENNPHQFVFNDYYTWCSGGNSVSALELSTAAKRVPKQGFERFEVGAFNSWRTSLLNNTAEVLERRSKLEPVIATLRTTKEPTTLEELRELYRKHPTLNDFSPVQYQDCPGEYAPKGNFVHVSTDRLSLYKTEPPKVTHRIYLNPPLEEVPAVVSYLCDRAIKENQPIYLKFCDSSVDLYLLESTLKRGDGIVLFTDAVQAKLLLNYIEEARQEHPNWFRAGSVPRMDRKIN